MEEDNLVIAMIIPLKSHTMDEANSVSPQRSWTSNGNYQIDFGESYILKSAY
jgi:hypothetical protein